MFTFTKYVYVAGSTCVKLAMSCVVASAEAQINTLRSKFFRRFSTDGMSDIDHIYEFKYLVPKLIKRRGVMKKGIYRCVVGIVGRSSKQDPTCCCCPAMAMPDQTPLIAASLFPPTFKKSSPGHPFIGTTTTTLRCPFD